MSEPLGLQNCQCGCTPVPLPTKPGLYRCADGDLWVIAPGSTTLRLLTNDGMRETDDNSEIATGYATLAAPFTRVRMVPADD